MDPPCWLGSFMKTNRGEEKRIEVKFRVNYNRFDLVGVSNG